MSRYQHYQHMQSHFHQFFILCTSYYFILFCTILCYFSFGNGKKKFGEKWMSRRYHQCRHRKFGTLRKCDIVYVGEDLITP